MKYHNLRPGVCAIKIKPHNLRPGVCAIVRDAQNLRPLFFSISSHSGLL